MGAPGTIGRTHIVLQGESCLRVPEDTQKTKMMLNEGCVLIIFVHKGCCVSLVKVHKVLDRIYTGVNDLVHMSHCYLRNKNVT